MPLRDSGHTGLYLRYDLYHRQADPSAYTNYGHDYPGSHFLTGEMTGEMPIFGNDYLGSHSLVCSLCSKHSIYNTIILLCIYFYVYLLFIHCIQQGISEVPAASP